MQLFAYCVYDRKSLAYGTPFFAPTDGSAVRSFTELANDLNTTVGRHPADFVLFKVGSFDDQNGALSGMVAITHVLDATAVVHQQVSMPLFNNGVDVAGANGVDELNVETRRAWVRDQGGNV